MASKFNSSELALALAALAGENRAREHALRRRDEDGRSLPQEGDTVRYSPESVGHAISNAVRASRRLARRK